MLPGEAAVPWKKAVGGSTGVADLLAGCKLGAAPRLRKPMQSACIFPKHVSGANAACVWLRLLLTLLHTHGGGDYLMASKERHYNFTGFVWLLIAMLPLGG